MGGGLEALGEGFVNDEDDFCADGFGFGTDGFLRRGDKGRDKYTTVSGCVKPFFAVDLPFFLVISPIIEAIPQGKIRLIGLMDPICPI